MIPIWWSYGLTSVGLIGLFLVYRYPSGLIGPVLSIAAQALWITYAVATGQHGFIFSALAYGAINTYGLRKRLTKEKASD